MSGPKIEVVKGIVPVCGLGEAPHWCPKEQVLYFVDIFNSRLLRYNPSNGVCNYVTVSGGKPVGFAVPIKDSNDQFMIGRGRDLCRVTWKTDQESRGSEGQMPFHTIEVVAEVDKKHPETQFNDGKCDPEGRLWAGTIHMTMGDPNITRQKGRLFCMKQNPTSNDTIDVEQALDGIEISNGMDWSLDGQTFFYVDSLAGKIYGFHFDCKTGKLDWQNQRVIFDFKNYPELKGFPDGLAICDRGHLWVATFEGKKVLVIDPDNGKLLKSIDFGHLADRITSVAFGGPDLMDIFVTSGSTKNEDGSIKGGQLFVIKDTGARGIPARCFDPTKK